MRTVLVTGAAGSIGSEICRQVECDELILLDTDESRLFDLWSELDDPSVHVRICDIRDAETVDRMFRVSCPDVVIHAAAYKHVPLMEAAPVDAVKTNVLGTFNVLNAAERYGADKFVLISTDKAVEPICVMGYTKAIAERVVLNAASRIDVRVVRFGNVLDSRGSVLPTWRSQIERGGPLTVTHPDVTRYFMSIPDAATLVIDSMDVGRSGDILVLEMGEPVRIADLAQDTIGGLDIDIEYTGLRPGEKLHEKLVTSGERLEPVTDGIYRVTR